MAYPSQFASRITALLHPSVHGLEFSQRQVLLWAKFPIDKCAKFSNCWYRSDRPFGTYRGQYVSYPSQFVSCIPPVLWLQLLLWTLLRGFLQILLLTRGSVASAPQTTNLVMLKCEWRVCLKQKQSQYFSCCQQRRRHLRVARDLGSGLDVAHHFRYCSV